MKVSPITDPLPGEHVVGVEPVLKPDIDLSWNRRLRLYTGRTLSDIALKTEQANRAGRLATRGQAVSPGVINGLEIGLEQGPDGQTFYQLSAGLGITAGGEDVVVPTLMRVQIFGTRVVAPSDVLLGVVPPDSDRPSGFAPFARDVGQTLSTFVNSTVPLPHVGILLLQPIVAEMVGKYDDSDPCERDPQNDAFEDWQLVDGCRLLYYAWPTEFINLPPLIEPPSPDEAQKRQALGVWRNRIAYTIFQEEANHGADEFFPWLEFGVPVGLVAFDGDWKPLFIDNHAVRRDGGKPKLRSRFVNESGGIDLGRDFSGLLPFVNNPFLWQARIQQFSEQVAEELDSALSFDDLVGHFAFLPPTGIMPRELLQFHSTQEAKDQNLSTRIGLGQFFPTSYEVEAVPTPLEQLDIPLESSASLAPFDLSASDQVLLLVPVPQIYFEPGLLHLEVPDPEFETSIQQLTIHRNKWLTRRKDLRDKASLLYRSAKGEDLSFPAVDPGATSDEQLDPDPIDPNDEQLKTPEEAYGVQSRSITGEPTKLVVEIVEELREQLANSPLFNRTYTAALAGMRPELQQSIASLTNRLTFDDTKKQLSMIGPLDDALLEKLSALANPDDTDRNYLVALSEIADKSADNELLQFNPLGLEKFIHLLETKTQAANDKVDLGFLRAQTDIYRIRQIILGNDRAASLAISPSLAGIAQGESAVATRKDIQEFYDALKGKPVPTAENPVAPADPVIIPIEPERPSPREREINLLRRRLSRKDRGIDRFFGENDRLSSVDDQILNIDTKIDLEGKVFDEIILTDIDFIQPKAPDDILGQPPIIGAPNLRTATIGERLQAPKSPEAKSFTVSSKHDIINDMISSGLHLDDIEISGLPEKDETGKYLFDNLGQPKRKKVPLGKLNLSDILDEPAPDKAEDESAYFIGAVELLDHTIGFLRHVEGRIQAYRQAITACQTVLNNLRDLFKRANQRLQTINEELAETRHDLLVAKTLLADEITRVNGINDRRDQVLEQVKFIAFQRPRFNELRLDTPVHILNPGPAEPGLPPFLQRRETPPANLRAMVDLFRHVPVRWLTHAFPFLKMLTTIPMLTGTLQSANQRALSLLADGSNLIAQERQTSSTQSLAMTLFGTATPRQDMDKAIHGVFSAQQQIIMQTRQPIAQFDFAQIAGQSWQRMQEIAADRVSLGDLIDGMHNRLDITQGVARELDLIAQVATALYEAFDDVLPILRLEWTELLSQYDTPVNLRNLANLPRWSEVPFLQRRSMQEMADWLYSRIDQRQPQAVGLMNDLVRVCILTASHAPVNAIITGHLPRPRRVTIGERIDLHTLDLSQVRIGMQALLFRQNQVVAQGVVEDLSNGQVAARILTVQAGDTDGRPANSISLEAGAQVHFVEKIFQNSRIL